MEHTIRHLKEFEVGTIFKLETNRDKLEQKSHLECQNREQYWVVPVFTERQATATATATAAAYLHRNSLISCIWKQFARRGARGARLNPGVRSHRVLFARRLNPRSNIKFCNLPSPPPPRGISSEASPTPYFSERAKHGLHYVLTIFAVSLRRLSLISTNCKQSTK